jgi:hypothetical protein
MTSKLDRRNFMIGSATITGSSLLSASTGSFAESGSKSHLLDLKDINMTMGESPLKTGLDAWYSYLVELLKPSKNRKVALNDIITPADIYSNTNFYDQYIFRSFVDRLVLTSPQDYTLGNANFTSAYSYYWSILLDRIIADIDVNLSAPDQNKIDEYDRQINEIRTKYTTIKTELETKWNAYAAQAGIDPKTDKFYIFKKKKFADDLGYATQLQGYSADIRLRLTKQNQIRLKSADEQDRILVSTYQYTAFEESKLMLPKIPDFEQTGGLTAADLTNLAVTGAAGFFEQSADITPVGDLRNFFANAKGEDKIEIYKRDKWEHQHDSDWGANASVGWPYFGATVSESHSSHIRESLDQVRSITVGWKNMANYFVKRGKWFNKDIFGYKRVVKLLDADKRLKEQLSRTVASLVIVRGINITLEFSDNRYMEHWEKSTFSGSGGVVIYGIPVGGGGSSYNYDWEMKKNEEKHTVTLIDDPSYARVAAFLSEEAIASVTDAEIRDDFLNPAYYTSDMITRFSK